ncbi:MAG TPA: hypothetical protein VGO03_09095 [Acidimicrobiia bacterium]|jgi:small-conductance mechanosensitive channel
MMHTLAVHIPNALPKSIFGWYHLTWDRPAGRLLWALVIWVIAMAIIVWLTRRPKPAEPPTWGQAMGGALITFALMILSYGTIPHEWLIYSNAYLHWNASKLLVNSGQHLIGPFHWLNFMINKQAVADFFTVLIYVFMLTVNVILVSKWQKRPAHKPAEAAAPTPEPEPQPAGTSAYGRPVTVRS